MKNFLRITFLLLICCTSAQAQSTKKPYKEKKHYLYFAWGYNKDYFSKSTIHFKSGSQSDQQYDFEWVDAKAHDRTGFDGIIGSPISVPQYVYRIGYVIDKSKGIGIEYNFDHAKYIVTDGQTYHIRGNMGGRTYDEYTTLPADSFHFEHTNGANFAMLSIIKEKIIYSTPNTKFEIAYLLKAGAGIVVPKTDVTLYGERLDNEFHVAGYIIGVEGGFTLNFWHNLFLAPTFKYAWANYVNSLSVDNGRVNHHFFAYDIILVAGYKFRF